jgi:predicted nucleotidyltransferase
MLTKKQIKLFGIFTRKPFGEYSFREFRELSEVKSVSLIQNSIKAFLEENLIKEKKVGTSNLYSLNHDNKLIYSYLDILAKESLEKNVKYSISLLQEELEKNTPFYSLAIFGSFAIGEQKKDSDLDLAVFIENEDKRKIIEASIKSIELKSFLKIDGHVITKNEFLEMLKVDYENLGKQIARKHLIIHNPLIFYSLLKEGMKNGFKIIY